LLGVLLAAITLGANLVAGTDGGLSPAAAEPRTAGSANRLEGVGRVIDGDTLDVGSVRVRLHGIDAFEHNQTCDLASGAWACGAAATEALRHRAEGVRLTCEVMDTDRYGRKVSRCQRQGIDVGRGLVADGLALAYRRYSQDYVVDELSARARRAGAWAGSFDRPEQWRRRGRRD
jgi:endonuclease YncB( thermonuclease family)